MLLNLIKSNIRNDLSHMITFFLIILLSVLMLHTGLMILFGYGKLFEEKRETLQSADLVVEQQTGQAADPEVTREVLDSSDYIDSYEHYQTVLRTCTYEDIDYEAGSKDSYETSTMELQFLPYGQWDQIEPPDFYVYAVEEYDNPIYLSLAENDKLFDANVGDQVDLLVDNKYYSFHVAGFFENITLGSTTPVAYVSPRQYRDWLREDEEAAQKQQTADAIAAQKETAQSAGNLEPVSDNADGNSGHKETEQNKSGQK